MDPTERASTAVVAAVLFLTVAIALPAAKAQPAAPSAACASSLQSMMPCWSLENINEKPTDQCCGPFKTAVKTQLPCVCDFYLATTGKPSVANMTVDIVLDIASQCGIANSTLTDCKAGGSKAGALSPKSETPEPTTPGSSKDGNGAGAKLAGSGLPGMFLIMMSMIFY